MVSSIAPIAVEILLSRFYEMTDWNGKRESSFGGQERIIEMPEPLLRQFVITRVAPTFIFLNFQSTRLPMRAKPCCFQNVWQLQLARLWWLEIGLVYYLDAFSCGLPEFL